MARLHRSLSPQTRLAGQVCPGGSIVPGVTELAQAATGRGAGEPVHISLPLESARGPKHRATKSSGQKVESVLSSAWQRLPQERHSPFRHLSLLTSSPVQADGAFPISPAPGPRSPSRRHGLPEADRCFQQGAAACPVCGSSTLPFAPPPQHGSRTEAVEKRRWEAPQLQMEQAIFSRAASPLLGCGQSCAGLCCSAAASPRCLTPGKGLVPDLWQTAYSFVALCSLPHLPLAGIRWDNLISPV